LILQGFFRFVFIILYGHTCAAEWYSDIAGESCDEKSARKQVAELLGHHRDEVTKIYLASL